MGVDGAAPIAVMIGVRPMSVKTFYYNAAKNKQGLYELIVSLAADKLWRFRIDEFDEKTREQEKKYHAMLSDIAEQAMHLNMTFGLNDWKRLCVQQFRNDCIENDVPRLKEYWIRNEFKVVPSLDGRSLVALGAQTRDFPKYVAAGFVEWLYHYGAVNNIEWSEPVEFDERYAN